ncbi:MAG: hypothetical protein NC211_04040 [Alistipes senegalensis]|nr:hypothetical protein [Oxalobacter formigenes]MCM1280988.1 hypothetical protein [Alistipes senegalensis]
MERDLTVLTARPQAMEIIPCQSERKTISFRTTEGYFSLTNAESIPEDKHSIYYEISDTAYEDESLSLYFAENARFQDEYDVVVLYWPMDEKLIDFLAGHLFLDTPLKLALHTDGRNRIQ